MMIPGSNLLSMALGLINPQALQHRSFVSRALSAAGEYVNTYAPATDIAGSMQPVDETLYQQLGLNLGKTYSTLYTSADVKTTRRDGSGDVLLFGGSTWVCESDTNWRVVDGWRRILCVEIPAIIEAAP